MSGLGQTLNKVLNMKSSGKRQGKKKKKQASSSLNNQLTTSEWCVTAQPLPHFKNVNRRDNGTFEFIQLQSLGIILVGTNAGAVGSAIAFTAATHIQQFSSFAAVFDQYKIKTIEIWATPRGLGTSSTYLNSGRMYSVTDYDDANIPSNTAQMLQYQNVIAAPFGMGHYRKWTPHMALAAYSGAFTSYANVTAGWIDVASPSVQHFGFKAMLDGTNAANDVQVEGLVRITVQFRNLF